MATGKGECILPPSLQLLVEMLHLTGSGVLIIEVMRSGLYRTGTLS